MRLEAGLSNPSDSKDETDSPFLHGYKNSGSIFSYAVSLGILLKRTM